MPNPAKQIVLGAALLVGITMVANADPLPRTGDKSAASDAGVPSGAGNFSGSAVGAPSPVQCNVNARQHSAAGRLGRCAQFSSLHERRRPQARSKRQIEGRELSSDTGLCERRRDASLHERRRSEGRPKLHAEGRVLPGASGLRCGCRNAPLYERHRADGRCTAQSIGRPAARCRLTL